MITHTNKFEYRFEAVPERFRDTPNCLVAPRDYSGIQFFDLSN